MTADSPPKTALYNIRINGSLYEEINSTYFLCFFFENADKFFADNLTFFFRFFDTCQFFIKTFLCIDADEIQIIVAVRAKYCFYLIAFIFTEKSLVYKDAGELVADGSGKKHGCNRSCQHRRKERRARGHCQLSHGLP